MIVSRSNDNDYFPDGSTWESNSIFLAGPTPRDENVESWRPQALKIIEDTGFNGIVYVPEPFAKDFDTQINWEWRSITLSSIVVFWVPRDLKTMLALTTNVEFGMLLDVRHMIYGRPPSAPNTRYLDWHYRRVTKNEPFDNLNDMLISVVKELQPQKNK